MKVIVAGAGPGGLKYCTENVIEAVKNADVVLTSERLKEPFIKLNKDVRILGVMDTVKFINDNYNDCGNKYGNICVLASGDTGFYSISATVSKRVNPEIDVEFLCGIGSLSYFSSKIKVTYENMKLVSLHGKEKSIIPFVCYNEKVFTLTGGAIKVQDIIKELIEAGLDEVMVFVGENLSMEGERIVSGRLKELGDLEFSDLSVMVIINKNYVNQYKTLKDSDFIRGKSPMTKEAIRNLSVSALEIMPTDVVYDIGAGTGSVTCALALKASESMVYAVEKNNEAVSLIKENMKNLGVKNIKAVCGMAPGAISDFPAADKVFIGGTTGNLKEIVETVLEKNEKTKIVVTAVTLETLMEANKIFSELDFITSVSCVNVANAEKLGRYNLMKSENPVYIIKGEVKVN